MSFIEHNNRTKAKKLAEYITGEELRKYVARKVFKYAGENVSVFDGAVGSGQLEQYIDLKHLYGVDIQEDSIDATQRNFPNADLQTKSFFLFDEDWFADVVVMNPPFSLKFKDLSEEEKQAIQKEFAWKKSGVVDDIFLLKSLNYAKEFGFYIMFPGVAYRKTEAMMRKLVGRRLMELNVIKNAFDDTTTDVLFLVIDKEKDNDVLYKEVYDCRVKDVIKTETCELDENLTWDFLRID